MNAMADNVENLMLEQFRRLSAKLDGMALDIGDIKLRMTSLEQGQSTLTTMYANQSRRIDRIEERLSRIERRLDLVEEPHS